MHSAKSVFFLALLIASAGMLSCNRPRPAYEISDGRVTIFPVDTEAIELSGEAADYFADVVAVLDTLDTEEMWISLYIFKPEQSPLRLSQADTIPNSSEWRYDFRISLDRKALSAYQKYLRQTAPRAPEDTIIISPDSPVRWDAWFFVDGSRSNIVSCSPHTENPPYLPLPKCGQ